MVEPRWAIDQIARVQVNCECGAVDCLQQLEGAIGAIWQCPAHHFVTELGALGLDGVDYLTRVLDGGIEKAWGYIVRVRSEPRGGVKRTSDINTTKGANLICEGEPVYHKFKISFLSFGVSVEEINPTSNLSNDNAMFLERPGNCLNPVALTDLKVWAIGRSVVQAPVCKSELFRVLRRRKDWSAEEDRISLGCVFVGGLRVDSKRR